MKTQNKWREKSPEKERGGVIARLILCAVIARLILYIVIARLGTSRGNLTLSMSS